MNGASAKGLNPLRLGKTAAGRKRGNCAAAGLLWGARAGDFRERPEPQDGGAGDGVEFTPDEALLRKVGDDGREPDQPPGEGFGSNGS